MHVVPFSQAPPVLLKVTDLCFNLTKLELFTNFQAVVRAGVTVVQGGEGRGKSTLLRLMAGDLQPQSGRVRVQGIVLAGQPQTLRQDVFWIDPRSTEFDPISPRAYFEQQRAFWPDFDLVRLPQLIQGLSLTEFMDKPIYMLSTGSKRKVWLAAAFASDAAVALLDDPFAALDKPSIRFVTEVLQGFASQAARAVVITAYEAPDCLRLAGVIDLGD